MMMIADNSCIQTLSTKIGGVKARFYIRCKAKRSRSRWRILGSRVTSKTLTTVRFSQSSIVVLLQVERIRHELAMFLACDRSLWPGLGAADLVALLV